jgi:hypothetical protein
MQYQVVLKYTDCTEVFVAAVPNLASAEFYFERRLKDLNLAWMDLIEFHETEGTKCLQRYTCQPRVRA